MEIESFVSLIPAALGVLSAVVAAFGARIGTSMLRRRANAERALKDQLLKIYDKNREMPQLLEMHREVIEGQGVREELMGQYLKHVEEALKQLDETQRSLVLDAVKQPSEQGRNAYMRKLVRKVAPQERAV